MSSRPAGLRRLGAELRALRAKRSRDGVQARTGISGSTIYRIEKGEVKPQKRTLLSLLADYGASKEQRDRILELFESAQHIGGQSWYRPFYDSVRGQYADYIGFEREAARVHAFESAFIPGLLQTREYAHAVISGGWLSAGPREIEDHVSVRMDRRANLTKDDPLQLWAITDEAALRRMVGGVDVMKDQLKQLIVEAGRPNVTLQVVPFSAGAHPAMHGSFMHLSFPDPEDPEIVYHEHLTGDLLLESRDDIRQYADTFDTLRAVALSPQETIKFVRSIIDAPIATEV